MKKLVMCFTIFSFTNFTLFAQANPQESQASPATTVVSDKPIAATGSTAAVSSQTGRQTSWQNWVFAGAALVIAAVGIAIVSINKGEEAH
jgi:hypothetical protein